MTGAYIFMACGFIQVAIAVLATWFLWRANSQLITDRRQSWLLNAMMTDRDEAQARADAMHGALGNLLDALNAKGDCPCCDWAWEGQHSAACPMHQAMDAYRRGVGA